LSRWQTRAFALTPKSSELRAPANIAFAQSPPGIGRKRPSLPGQLSGDRASAVPLQLPQMRPVGWCRKKKKKSGPVVFVRSFRCRAEHGLMHPLRSFRASPSAHGGRRARRPEPTSASGTNRRASWAGNRTNTTPVERANVCGA
ncbi:MAG: hypothetical protein ACK559_41650, partial [bacterium]